MPKLIPTISVILPTRNRASWLRKAVCSVLKQSWKDFSLIVVDDGSSDETQDLLAEIRKTHLRARLEILSTPGLGVSGARNFGISQNASPFVALLDSDDEWLPRKLELQMAALAQNKDAALCHTDEIWFRHGERVNPCKHHEKSGGYIFEKCLPRCMISPSSALIRREVLDVVGLFDESMPVCEDYDLWLRITLRYPVCYLPQKLVKKHGGHADQLSRRFSVMDRFRIDALEKILRDPHLTRAQRVLVEDAIRDKSRIIAQGAQKRGNVQLAREFSARIHTQSSV